MTAPVVIRVVLGECLETGFEFVQPVCIVGWVTWEVGGSVLVSVDVCLLGAEGTVCMGFQCEGQNPVTGDQGFWDGPCPVRAPW